jgi:SulP family sulfate permease
MQLALLSDLKHYTLKQLRYDLIAGLTVAIVLIPQGMAYSLLAGLDPIYGLYAALIPLVVYSIFASSRYLSIGPVALMSIILLGGISTIVSPDEPEYLQLVIFSSFLAGLIQIGFAIFKIGNLTTFLSKPFMGGFITAAGIIILISQLKYLFSLELPRRVSVVNMLADVLNGMSLLNWVSLALGLGSMLVILLAKTIHRTIPGALLVVIIGSLLVKVLELDEFGVPIIGDMPKGLPAFNFSFLKVEYFLDLLPVSLIVASIGYVGSYSISMSLGSEEDKKRVSPNKELLALGLAKTIGSFFVAMPNMGSFTRSAINYEVGGRTQVSSLITAFILLLTLMFLGGLFYYLPEPILAGIVITSVFSLIDYKYALLLLHEDRRDFVIFIITFIATLLFGITNGLIIGILASFINVTLRANKVNYAVLGRLPSTEVYRNIERYPDAEESENKLILRFSQSIYFANAEKIIKSIKDELEIRQGIENLIISFPTFSIPDSTATSALYQLVAYCQENNVRLIITDLNGPVRDYFHKVRLYERIGMENFYLTVEDAVSAIEHGNIGKEESIQYSSQTNYQKKKNIPRLFTKYKN